MAGDQAKKSRMHPAPDKPFWAEPSDVDVGKGDEMFSFLCRANYDPSCIDLDYANAEGACGWN